MHKRPGSEFHFRTEAVPWGFNIGALIIRIRVFGVHYSTIILRNPQNSKVQACAFVFVVCEARMRQTPSAIASIHSVACSLGHRGASRRSGA